MSALSRAHAHLVLAIDELEQAVEEAPRYATESLRFLQHELKDAGRRIGNVEKVIGAAMRSEPDDPEGQG